MIRAGGTLLFGGEAAGRQPKGGVLRMLSRKDGRTLGQKPLDSPPVWDGMAAVGGRLFMALRSGSVVCMGSD